MHTLLYKDRLSNVLYLTEFTIKIIQEHRTGQRQVKEVINSEIRKTARRREDRCLLDDIMVARRNKESLLK